MREPVKVEVVTSVAADPATVWSVVSTMPGVNYELHPLVHMTSPRSIQGLPDSVMPGQVAFRSWLLLFGVLPFDRHALALEQIERAGGFVEESTTWMHRRWRHERTLRPLPDGGCLVTDRVLVEPRFRLASPVVAAIVQRLFDHRHRRLAKRVGAATNGGADSFVRP